jgi:long-chain fatty acid transport protein
MPDIVFVGIGGRPTERLWLEFDFNYLHWQTYDRLVIDFLRDNALDRNDAKNWGPGFTFRLGAEYGFFADKQLKLRAGLGYDMSPTPSDKLDPMLPDADRILVSLGLGYTFKFGLSADVGYLAAIFFDRTASNPDLPATYKTFGNLVGISLGYRLK